MKKTYLILTFILALIFSLPSLASMEGIAVIDYRTIFLGTDMARESFEDLRESKDFKKLAEEGQIKQQELISISEELNKNGKTMSEEDKADKGKTAQTLYQDIQYTNQKLQALEAEVLKKLETDQMPNVQKVVNELIKAKKISLLFNSQALLAYDVADTEINITPEVIDLVNKANKGK
jgi:Skp family chaperone for outer membrane proteins